jgi:hypothetical protein
MELLVSQSIVPATLCPQRRILEEELIWPQLAHHGRWWRGMATLTTRVTSA